MVKAHRLVFNEKLIHIDVFGINGGSFSIT